MSFRHVDLFSGIGGFALAAKQAGFETVAFCETDPFCSEVLAKNFPHVRNHGDIRNVERFECDIITGGFPCQPFSVAGQRRGSRDDRFLWPEMRRVIAASRATWVLGENVPGIVSLELDDTLFDLENLGYACQAFTIPACAVDAAFIGDRVWIVAASGSARLPTGWQVSVGAITFQSMPAGGCLHRRVALPSERQYEWEEPRLVERPLARATDGLPANLVRLGSAAAIKAFGNAIVPQIAFVFFELMKRAK
jgi:site-specific DNA-cytosine methylase